jgi:ABC-type Fe3+ transport system substrate-binding protein
MSEPRQHGLLDLNVLRAAAIPLAVLSGSGVRAFADDTTDLVRKAQQEKEVVYYTELIVDQIVRPLAAAFEKTYGIKVVFWRGDSQQVTLKLSMERKAARTQADVWSSPSGLGSMISDKVIAPFMADNAAALPAEFRDRNGYWVATNMIVLGAAVNTSLVAAAERPRSHDDLLAPRWRDKLVWKPNDITGAWGFIGNALTSMGEQAGLAYLRKLNAQNIAPLGAATRAILDQVGAGEYPMMLGVSNHNVEIARKAGAPIAWLPLDAAWATLHTIGLIAGAPHPNAGRLFIDFVLSKTGQEIFRNAGYLPARLDTPAGTPSLRPQEGGFRANLFAPETIDRSLARWSAIYAEIFR